MHIPTAVLSFLMRGDEILLVQGEFREGEKTWNGVSGFSKGQEKTEQSAMRALYTDVKIQAYPSDLERVAVLHFYELDEHRHVKETLQISVFLCEHWIGEPQFTPGLTPRWFSIEDIPYNEMFEDMKMWLPKVLEGEQLIVEILSEKDPSTNLTRIKDVLIRNALTGE